MFPMPTHTLLARLTRGTALAAVLAALVAASGCGYINKQATKSIANTLAKPGDVFTRDDDPELVRRAIPFALKLYESLLETVPKHQPLLVATCGGFTSYAYAFVQSDADMIRTDDHARARELDDEALKLYVRAKNYCLRAMDVRFPGMSKALLREDTRAQVLLKAEKKDVELLYWTAASWGAAISLGLDQPDLAVDFPTVRAIAERALALDDTWSHGALHEMMITIESVEQLGGSADRARDHFKRAIDLQHGNDTSAYLNLALGVSVNKQNRTEFEKLLNDALAVDVEKDPSNRVVNLINKKRAQSLLDHADALFVKHPAARLTGIF
jgi:tetratricopeptide (TPR) repeat protein